MLTVNNINIAYGRQQVVTDFSLRLKRGEIGALLGPSGCSKTTVLRAIAGFIPVSAGAINIDGQCVSSLTTNQPPETRNVGVVFQDFALFPHLNVRDNVAFGIRHWKAAKQKTRVNRLLSLIHLEEMADRFPHELSGGQQQRVALIRALAPMPKLLLMDEPFSNIDVEFKEKLATQVTELLKEEKVTALIVTHEQSEAFLMADLVGVISKGRMQQWDTGYDVYHKPINRFVAEFVGQGVFLPGTVLDDGRVQTELAVVEGQLPHGNNSVGDTVEVLVRPDDIVHNDCSPRKAIILNRVFRGASYLYTLQLSSGAKVYSLVHSHHDHAVGEALGITVELAHAILFARADGY